MIQLHIELLQRLALIFVIIGHTDLFMSWILVGHHTKFTIPVKITTFRQHWDTLSCRLGTSLNKLMVIVLHHSLDKTTHFFNPLQIRLYLCRRKSKPNWSKLDRLIAIYNISNWYINNMILYISTYIEIVWKKMPSFQSCVLNMIAVYNACIACKLCILLNHQSGVKLIGNTFGLRNRLKMVKWL